MPLLSLLPPNQDGAVCAPLMIDSQARIGEFTLAVKQDATARRPRFDEAHAALSGQTEEEA